MPDSFFQWLMVVNVVWLLGLSVFTVVRKPGEDAKTQLTDIDKRVTGIEATLKHMPTSEELESLRGSVAAVDERTKALAQSMDSARSALTRIETYLLNNKK